MRKHNPSLYLLIAIGVIALAVALGLLRRHTGALDSVDTQASSMANSLRSTCLTPLMRGITWFGYETGLTVVICIIYWLGYTAEAISFLLMVLFGLALNSIAKDFFDLPRPPDGLISKLDDPRGYGYPSGHGQWGALYAWLIYSLTGGSLSGRSDPSSRETHSVEQKLFLGRYWRLFLLPVALLVLSRLYLGVHYLSDIVGGFICGIGLILGATAIQGYLQDFSGLRKSIRRSLPVKVLLSFALSALYFGLSRITPEASGYSGLSGSLFGFILTYTMLKVRWRPRNLPLAIIIAVIGLASMIALRFGLAAVLPKNDLGAYCRYLLLGVYLAASPLLFLRMGLLTKRE